MQCDTLWIKIKYIDLSSNKHLKIFWNIFANRYEIRPTRNYIHRSNHKRFLNFVLTKVRHEHHFQQPSYMRTSEISKVSPILAFRVTLSSPARFDRKVRHDRKPRILSFSGQVHWNFRFTATPDFAVKSIRGACG